MSFDLISGGSLMQRCESDDYRRFIGQLIRDLMEQERRNSRMAKPIEEIRVTPQAISRELGLGCRDRI